jgi:hypothetical protein
MKTTKHHARIFERECEYWFDYFGQKDWERWYEHKMLDGATGEADANESHRLAIIRVSKDFKKYNKQEGMWELYKSAFHEVCEVLFCDLARLASKSCSDDLVIKEVHRLIRILENTVWKEYAKKKGLKSEIQDVD